MGIISKLNKDKQGTPKEMPKVEQINQIASQEDAEKFLEGLKVTLNTLQVITYQTVEQVQESMQTILKQQGEVQIAGLPKEYYYLCMDLISVNQHLLRMLLQGIVERVYIEAGNNFDRKSA